VLSWITDYAMSITLTVADPEISKKGGVGGGHPLKIAKNYGIWGLKSWGLLILHGKFRWKRGGGLAPSKYATD
jgi:hypothetical protein